MPLRASDARRGGSAARTSRNDTPCRLEPLESRTLFGGSPFPNIADLESPTNTVVRLTTNMGDIDFELFDSVAPLSVANYLNYIRDGDYDHSIFHRLATGFVLQGGDARFINNATPSEVFDLPSDAPVMNEFMRSNLERTIAMAKLGNDPNSATNNFFINLGDNSANLDMQNGGFTVFGRVLGDSSWSVVQAMAALSRNATALPQFTDLPVRPGFNPANPTEDTLVLIEDAEIIKAGAASAFYSQRFYYPEGFAGSTISEFLPIGNPGNAAVSYQVIARAEVRTGDITTSAGWFRDRVISTGTIAPLTRGGITISQFGPGGVPGANDLLPQGVPYSLEVHATGSLAVNLSHFDFGTATGDSLTTTTSTIWAFGDLRKDNGNVNDFLVWSNVGDDDAAITITFFFEGAVPVSIVVGTEDFRRGGLAIANTAQIPDDTAFSARLVSTVPIVAALSHFDSRGDREGSTSIGISGNGSDVGIIPMGREGTDAAESITFINANNESAVVQITLSFENPAEEVVVSTLIVFANRRESLDMSTLAHARVVNGDPFSIRYSVIPQGRAIYAHATLSQRQDGVSNPFATSAATSILFAEGFMDPGRANINVFETISVCNPNSQFFTGTNTTANVTFTFFYTDGFSFDHNVSIDGGRRLDLDLHTLQAVLDQGTTNNRFFYSVRVSSNVAIVAQMFHYDLTLGGLQASGGFSTLGTLSGTVTRLDQL